MYGEVGQRRHLQTFRMHEGSVPQKVISSLSRCHMLVFLIMPHTVHTDSLRYNTPHASVSSLSHDLLERSAQYSHFIRASSPRSLLTATALLLESHHSSQKLFAYDLISHNFE